MRLEVVRIKQHKIIISEMTVDDVLIILANLKGIISDDIKSLSRNDRDLIIEIASRFVRFSPALPADKLNDEQIETLMAAFKRVNARFFDKSEQKPISKNAIDYYTNKLTADINKTVIALIERGHRNVLNYSWSFYLDVIATINAD